MKGHLRNVDIGFRGERQARGLVRGLNPVLIYSAEALKKLNKNEIGIVGKIGNKKKMEIAEYALKNNIRLSNLNSKKFLDKIEEKIRMKKEEKTKKYGKKADKEKKAKEAEKKKEEEEKKAVEEKDKKENQETQLEKAIKEENVEVKK
mgnify:FL=1